MQVSSAVFRDRRARRAAVALVGVAAMAIGAPARAAADTSLPGREIAHAQERGNCLACHRMPADPGAVTDANLGPVLENLKRRFPDREKLRVQVWDARRANPDTLMPPYGAHGILTPAEIDAIVDYLLTL
jgi:sulfur-oxidizing protein SoxX